LADSFQARKKITKNGNTVKPISTKRRDTRTHNLSITFVSPSTGTGAHESIPKTATLSSSCHKSPPLSY